VSDLRSGVHYDPIVVSAESTVVAEYVSESADEAAYPGIWRHFHSYGIFTA